MPDFVSEYGPVRTATSDEEYITVRVRRIDAQALVLGGLAYATAVGRGEAQEGASPMRLRIALRDALNEAHREAKAPQ